MTRRRHASGWGRNRKWFGKSPAAPSPPRETFATGSGVTAESLAELLENGDPNLREAKPWVPHRPARPEKSEGGVRFELVSEYQPQGDQPRAIDELAAGLRRTSATRCCSASPAREKLSPWRR